MPGRRSKPPPETVHLWGRTPMPWSFLTPSASKSATRALSASGKPMRPSTTATRMSLTLFFSSGDQRHLPADHCPDLHRAPDPPFAGVLEFVSWKNRKAVMPALKAIYRAKDADAGRKALEGSRPVISRYRPEAGISKEVQYLEN